MANCLVNSWANLDGSADCRWDGRILMKADCRSSAAE